MNFDQNKQIKVDRYKVELPSDIYQADDLELWEEQMCELAINEARECSRIYAMPATWECCLLSGSPDTFNCQFQVKRYRYK